ncbi:MAG: hypothetical protein V1921_08385 [Candidatus Altiarchaeota archaeon]
MNGKSLGTALFSVVMLASLTAGADPETYVSGWQPYALIATLVVPYYLIIRRKDPLEVRGVYYNNATGRIQLVVKNQQDRQLFLRTSLRRVERRVACSWKVSPDERIDYAIDLPMIPGKVETLRKSYTLLAKDDSVLSLEPSDTCVLDYRPMDSISQGDEINVRIYHGLGKSRRCLEHITKLQFRLCLGRSLGMSCADKNSGLSLAPTRMEGEGIIQRFAS